MLNPDLNAVELAKRFSEDDRVRIENVLETDIVERVHQAARQDVPYEFLSNIDGKNVAIPSSQMAAFDAEQGQDFRRKLLDQAARGIGFFYCGYMMARKLDDTANESLKFLHSVFEFLNSDDMLSFVSTVTGRDDLRSADAHFTRYTPGQFLTRHRDDNVNEQRRIAYVLSLSKDWHPDWGGLLQFFEDDGTTRDSWAPKFNSLALFDVRHVHSVTFVAPFAMEPRLSVTGWFRAKDW